MAVSSQADTSGTTLHQAGQSHRIQAALSASLAADVATLWPDLDPKRLSETFPQWLALMMTLVDRYYGMASLAAQIYYRDTRQAHLGVPTPDGVLKLASPASREWMTKAFGYSGPGLLQNGKWLDSSALSVTQGTAVRIVQSGARQTVLESVKTDPKAIGWHRVTDGAPCAFCALLASRGVVSKSTLYRTKESASFKAHNDCGCTAAPVFSRSQQMPEVNHEAARVYQEATAGVPNPKRLAAFRKAWNEHLANQPAEIPAAA